MATGEYLDVLMFFKANLLLVVEPEYLIYLHNETLSANVEKRRKAGLNIQSAMQMVRTDVIAYGRESDTRIWRVLIV